MSMVPMMFRDWWEDWGEDWRPSRLMDQHFGMGLRRDDLLSSLSTWPSRSLLRNSYYRPWRSSLTRQESSSTINFTKDKFEVILDVQQFSPEEITVKASNNSVIVEGKHEEKPDEHGYISRQFTRRYVLPSGYEMNDIVSSLSSDGVLTITAPKRPPPVAGGERTIPITKTGPAKQNEAPVPPVRSYQPQPEPPRDQPRETNIPVVTSPSYQSEPPRDYSRETNIPIVTSPSYQSEPPRDYSRETNIPIVTSPSYQSEPPRDYSRETNIPIVTSP